MPGQNEFYDLLFAYSLGCLDEDDLLKLREYFKSGEEFAWQELGEFQNLVSLLPSILNIETPSPAIKDNVARKLYKIKGEIPAKKILHDILPDAPSQFDEEKISTKDAASEEEYTSSEKLNTRTDGFEIVTAKKKPQEYFRPPQETQIHGRDSEYTAAEEDKTQDGNVQEQPALQTVDSAAGGKDTTGGEKKKTYTLHGNYGNDKKSGKNKKSFPGILISIILFIIVAAGIIVTYLKFSSDVKNYKSNVESLNKQIKNLSSQMSVSKELSELLQSKNLRIINLQGTATGGFGKIIISLDNSKGFLQLSQMPVLASGKVYQLWLSMNKKNVSMGTFSPANPDEYFPITLPEITNQQSAKFLVSEEPMTGSLQPGNKIFLTGSF